MRFKNEIVNIALAGMLMAMAIVIGTFGNFPLLGGQVYLSGIIIFVMPLVLPVWYSFIAGTVSAVLTDVLTGWGMYSWITFVAYGVAILIIWAFTKIKIKLFFIVGMIIAAIAATAIYFGLEWVVPALKADALRGSIATIVEFGISVPVAALLYWPIKRIIKK